MFFCSISLSSLLHASSIEKLVQGWGRRQIIRKKSRIVDPDWYRPDPDPTSGLVVNIVSGSVHAENRI